MGDRVTAPTGYWTFFCNPAICEPERFLTDPEIEGWYKCAAYQAKGGWFRVGDKGVCRVGIDRRTKRQLAGRPRLSRGIYALLDIIGLPQFIPDDYVDGYPDPKDALAPAWRVRFRYTHRLLDRPILLKSLPRAAFDRYLVEGFRASSMPLRSLAYAQIMELAEAV